MSDTGRTTKLTVEADSTPAKRGLGEVKAAAVDMAQGVEAAGQRAGKGVEAIGRNPEAAPKVQTAMILAIAFAEAIAIYALVVALIIKFVP